MSRRYQLKLSFKKKKKIILTSFFFERVITSYMFAQIDGTNMIRSKSWPGRLIGF